MRGLCDVEQWSLRGEPQQGGPVNRYDPQVPPDPVEWLGLDEQERIQLCERFHRAARARLPSLAAHAVFTRRGKPACGGS